MVILPFLVGGLLRGSVIIYSPAWVEFSYLQVIVISELVDKIFIF